MKRIKHPRYKFILASGDLIAIVIGMVAVAAWYDLFPAVDELGAIGKKIFFILLFAFAWLFLLQYQNLYTLKNVFWPSRHTVLLLKSSVYALITYAAMDFFLHPDPWITKRSAVALLFATILFLLILWRFTLFARVWNIYYGKKERRRRTVVVGMDKRAAAFALELRAEERHDISLVGWIGEELEPNSERDAFLPRLGGIQDLDQIIEHDRIGGAVIASEAWTSSEIIRVAERLTMLGVQVDIASSRYDIVSDKWDVDEYCGVPVVRLMGRRHSKFMNIVKRVFDYSIAVGGIILLLPVYAAIALGVKLTSPGPIIYRQRRVGKDGILFPFFKFRSMEIGDGQSDDSERQDQYLAAIKSGGPMGKIITNRKVTPIGRFIRETSLDELPQLFNVLRGEMSLVGPRPCLPYELELYDEWHKKRLAVLPGCTGLWQISDRLNISFEDMVLLDYFYSENMSPWLDVKIIFKTIPQILFARAGK